MMSTVSLCLLFSSIASATSYDLAISKTILTPGPYASGDVVNYELIIENQGTTDFGSNITITDYLPA